MNPNDEPTSIIDGEVPTAALWVWIVLILVALISFWAQAVVTEERLVPTLNLIATRLNIPEDVAGATLMAAGASSPELFSSIVALFITHSSLGLGTVVGSEIFNQLAICAGAVFCAKSGKVELNPAVIVREAGFYALSVAMLFYTVSDVRAVEDDSVDHIFVSFSDACMLVAAYVVYVLVCSYFDTILRFLNQKKDSLKKKATNYGAVAAGRASINHLEDLPFIHKQRYQNEPEGNFERVKLLVKEDDDSMRHAERGVRAREDDDDDDDDYHDAEDQELATAGFDRNKTGSHYLMRDEKPSEQHGLYDIEENSHEKRLSCFLWQRSYFYNKARFGSRGWHLRWFTLNETRVHSVPDRLNSAKHQMMYPKFREMEVDEKRLIIHIVNPIDGARDFYVMAPSEEILAKVVLKLQDVVQKNEEAGNNNGPGDDDDDDDELVNGEFETSDDHEILIEYPHHASKFTVVMFILTFPFRAMMHYTVVDVRSLDRHGNPVGTLRNAYFAAGMCLVWLVVGSYAMVASLESLAALLDIPDAVVGVTVSAMGTSLPNYVAGAAAAKRGFGNLAVSNAFGSNTFNIMIALGLPWLLYTSFGTGFKPYHGLRNENMVQSVIILGCTLLLFFVFVIPSGFVLYRWHGYVFIGIYICYLIFAIGQVYW